MYTQAEMNFYGMNPKNIIHRGQNKKISCICTYDGMKNEYKITRRTPKTIWTERTTDKSKADTLFYRFLYLSMQKLENLLKNGTLTN